MLCADMFRLSEEQILGSISVHNGGRKGIFNSKMLALVLKMYVLKGRCVGGGTTHKGHIQGLWKSIGEYFASKPLRQTITCSLWTQGQMVSPSHTL